MNFIKYFLIIFIFLLFGKIDVSHSAERDEALMISEQQRGTKRKTEYQENKLLKAQKNSVEEGPNKTYLAHKTRVNKLKKLARNGDKNAQFNLALIYKNGWERVVAPNLDKAFYWFNEAAEEENTGAHFELGLMCKKGWKGVDPDLDGAAEWFGVAASLGYYDAFLELAELAQENNNALAQYNLGATIEDNREAIQWLIKASKQGHPFVLDKLKMLADYDYENAQFVLGLIYKNGWGVEPSLDEATEWFSLAAKQGQEDALKELKILAQEDNNAKAQYDLGYFHESADEGAKREGVVEAVKWYIKSASQGYQRAVDILEDILSDGLLKELAFPEDYEDEEARKRFIELIEFLAQHDNENAQFELGLISYNEANADAVKWFTLAAKKKHADAQYYLGTIYENGWEGIKPNRAKAIKWFSMAANQGHEEASNKLFLSFFRGIHYINNLFDDEKIKQNVEGADTTFLVSSAACTLAGSRFLSCVPGSEELRAGKLICKILKDFKEYNSDLYYKFHETYTNDHIRFHNLLQDEKRIRDWLDDTNNTNLEKRNKYLKIRKTFNKADNLTKKAFVTYRKIFQRLAGKNMNWEKAVKRNPFVSFSCNARHGLRYSLAQKSFTGGNDVKLLPEYDNNGNPKNKYLGRLYSALFHPMDITHLEPTFVLDKQARNKMNIKTHFGNNILSENEITFFGYLPEGFICISEPIDVPIFSSPRYPTYYEKKFGITDQKYHEWRKKIMDKENDVDLEKKIISHIIDRKSSIFEQKAKSIIEKKNGLKIYPDVLSPYYTHIEDSDQNMIVSQWLQKIRSGNNAIYYSKCAGNKPLSREGVYLFEKSLMREPVHFRKIWIKNYEIANSGCSFYKILKNEGISLSELILEYCCLNMDDVIRIASSLQNNKTLLVLSLDGNEVKDRGAKKIADSLKTNNTLKFLSLNSSKITNIQYFAELFPKGKKPTGKKYKGYQDHLNKTIEEIKLEGNNVGLDDNNLFKQITNGLRNNMEHKG